MLARSRIEGHQEDDTRPKGGRDGVVAMRQPPHEPLARHALYLDHDGVGDRSDGSDADHRTTVGADARPAIRGRGPPPVDGGHREAGEEGEDRRGEQHIGHEPQGLACPALPNPTSSSTPMVDR